MVMSEWLQSSPFEQPTRAGKAMKIARAFHVWVPQDDVAWTVNPASLEAPFTGTHTLQTEPEP
jgi:hypothetical protein